MQAYDFSGIWQSKYKYQSHSRKGEFEDKHLMRIYQRRNKLVIESLPKVNDSYVIMNVTVNNDLLTGVWQETTNPQGYYKGATYHGALQLVIDKTGKFMKGKWLGAGKDKAINDGPLELKYIGKNVPADTKA